MASARAVRCIGALAGIGLLQAPPAGAQPQQPDWDRYTAVKTSDYTVAIPTSGYNGAVSSVQFSTPAGQNCSVVINIRGEWDTATCTGLIPGGSHTRVTASYLEPGKFDDAAPSPGQAKLLPAGSKIIFTRGIWTSTCAVDQSMTACMVNTIPEPGQTTPNTAHGFVLGPNSSSTF
ncbi:hypothetical protein [Mycobacteroides abscessus]|uniref:hypothetical protein n=1 Tax=Mycobacteroides abscessus TaxID=36809 RepID=UPI0009A6154C|nr:hypothetical protein [Mycobacteroides abscessus]SLJ75860.1 Uncharacterised protein [Mycobacteroides abscessus subsp. abscessus]SLJ77643.1 Uncharacterised protein [Mycobacteroides abscessus subsp. abscessus]